MSREGKGRWALVTGASAGIGTELARVFADHGFGVVLTARREDRLQALARELEPRVPVRVVAADLADPDAPAQLHRATADIAVDALVNNAGFGAKAAFTDDDWESHAALIQVLVTAVVQLTHLYLPGMVSRRYGRILNVASVAGLLPGAPKRTLYGPAKAFVIKFSEALAGEHVGDGVHVTALCPGFTYSEFHDVAGNRAEVSRLPKLLWMDAATVARQGYEAVMAGRAVYVNGPVNRAITAMTRLVPMRVSAAMIRRQSLRLSAKRA
jgi:short-subunit dehydrogenase